MTRRLGEPRYRLERLAAPDLTGFRCTREPVLERYLKERAERENRRGVSAVYLLIDSQTGTVAGYFTLAAASIAQGELPSKTTKGIPRYAHWPVLILGRMARHDEAKSVGPLIVARAFEAALEISKSVGTLGLIVDAKNDGLVAWYRSLGFTSFQSREHSLFFLNQTMADYLTAMSHRLSAVESASARDERR